MITDKETEQRKALNLLDQEQQESSPSFLDSSYLRVGTGISHFIKGPISTIRRHRIASQSDGELSIGILRAVVVSRSSLAIRLARVTRSDVYLCKDKHSDATNYMTCHPPVCDLLCEAEHVAEQRVPEIHLGWHSHCKTHDLVRRPGCIAVNARGDAIISDLEGNVLVMVSRHLPAQVKVIAGKWGPPGRAAAVEGVGTRVRLSYPWGLAVYSIEPRKNEVCFAADAGNNAVRLIRKVHRFDLTQLISPVAVTSSPPLQPFGLACVPRGLNAPPLLVVSEEKRRRLVIVALDESLVRGHVLSRISESFSVGLQNPASIAVCGSQFCTLLM